jgi:hypothetical protein
MLPRLDCGLSNFGREFSSTARRIRHGGRCNENPHQKRAQQSGSESEFRESSPASRESRLYPMFRFHV